ncbi:MAG: hypothetical protein K0R50_3434 [Eubacterium sp.]|jgi:uncharacterized protein YrrD|nr:hypothetical protein [Eubacterium sp.]
MKRTEEIIGLPIISISNGNDAGIVKSVIINPEKGTIDYIVVDFGAQILNAKVIPAGYILGIGDYALTIESEDSISEINKLPAAMDLLQKNVQVRGTRVLTKKGRMIGEIGDLYIDEDADCSIIGLEFIADAAQKNIKLIPRDSIITFSKNLIIVNEDVETKLLERASDLSSGVSQDAGNNINSNLSSSNEVHSDEVSDMMETKHREYLNGKIATKTIYDNDGNTLVEENTVIDDAIFEIAKSNGKVIELVMNNK